MKQDPVQNKFQNTGHDQTGDAWTAALDTRDVVKLGHLVEVPSTGAFSCFNHFGEIRRFADEAGARGTPKDHP